MIRFVLLAAIVLFVAVLLWKLYFSPSVPCERCEGEGSWIGARERVRCDVCKGSGRVPRKG